MMKTPLFILVLALLTAWLLMPCPLSSPPVLAEPGRVSGAEGVPTKVATRALAVYFDERYPSNWVNPREIAANIRKTLDRLGIPYRILNAEELRDYMLRETGVVVFTSDVAPDTVWNGSSNSLALQWIRGGGVVVWTGDWEFYYIGYANGSKVHRPGIENSLLGRQVTVAVDGGAVTRPTELGARYIPSFKSLRSFRPFDESRLKGVEYEAYGAAELGGSRLLDPCAVKVGEGYFVKVSANGFGDNFGFAYALELVLNRFYGAKVRLTPDSPSPYFTGAGIVYILPSGASSPYWREKYGDRIYFYTKSNLSDYRRFIENDFRVISSAGYDFAILVVPLSDTEVFRFNARLIDELAQLARLRVLYLVLPKWEYGDEWEYLIPGSRVSTALLSVSKHLLNLSSTLAVAVWYGWEGRAMNPGELEGFYLSLGDAEREKVWLWIDQPFIEKANSSGIFGVLDRLNATLVTELYDPVKLSLYQNATRKQVIVTGYWNASTVDEWLSGVKGKLSLVDTPGRLLGIWIFWDVDDGWGEAYRAYIGGELANPLHRKEQGPRYYILAESEYGQPIGTGWYNPGENATIEVQPTLIELPNGTRRSFLGWYEGPELASTQPRYSFPASSNRTLTARWRTLYLVEVTTEKGAATGAGWYEAGSTARISIAPTEVPENTTHKWVFYAWEVNGEATSRQLTLNIKVNRPLKVRAVWRLEKTAGQAPGWAEPVSALAGLIIVTLAGLLAVRLAHTSARRKAREHASEPPITETVARRP